MPSPRTAKRYFWVSRIPFLDGVIRKMTLWGVYTLVPRTCESVTVNHGKGSLQTCKPETPEDRELTTVAYPHGSPLMTRAIRSGEVSGWRYKRRSRREVRDTGAERRTPGTAAGLKTGQARGFKQRRRAPCCSRRGRGPRPYDHRQLSSGNPLDGPGGGSAPGTALLPATSGISGLREPEQRSRWAHPPL